jgi:hypothetical protein
MARSFILALTHGDLVVAFQNIHEATLGVSRHLAIWAYYERFLVEKLTPYSLQFAWVHLGARLG